MQACATHSTANLTLGDSGVREDGQVMIGASIDDYWDHGFNGYVGRLLD